jgi:hypothetical protein
MREGDWLTLGTGVVPAMCLRVMTPIPIVIISWGDTTSVNIFDYRYFAHKKNESIKITNPFSFRVKKVEAAGFPLGPE